MSCAWISETCVDTASCTNKTQMCVSWSVYNQSEHLLVCKLLIRAVQLMYTSIFKRDANKMCNFIHVIIYLTHPGSGVCRFSSSTSHWPSTGCGRGLICSSPGRRWKRCESGIRSGSRWRSSSGRAPERRSRCWDTPPLQGGGRERNVRGSLVKFVYVQQSTITTFKQCHIAISWLRAGPGLCKISHRCSTMTQF